MNSKTISAIIAVIVLLVGVYYFINKSNTATKKTNNNTEVQIEKQTKTTDTDTKSNETVKIEKKYGDLTSYVSKKLSKEDVTKVQKVIIDINNQKKKNIQELIAVYKTKDEAKIKALWEKIAKVREENKKTLLPFISEDKKAQFEKDYAEEFKNIKIEFKAANNKNISNKEGEKKDGEKATENKDDKKVLDKTGKTDEKKILDKSGK